MQAQQQEVGSTTGQAKMAENIYNKIRLLIHYENIMFCA